VTRPTALITGASAGIGTEFARVFAANGYDLILVARREDRLTALAQRASRDRRQQCRDGERSGVANGRKIAAQGTSARGQHVDVLVNNAGIRYGGAFTVMDHEAVNRMVLLNAATLATMTAVHHRHGRAWFRTDLNVASLSAFQAVPTMSLYAATKAFVLSFTEGPPKSSGAPALRATALCPGLPPPTWCRTSDGTAVCPKRRRCFRATLATLQKQGSMRVWLAKSSPRSRHRQSAVGNVESNPAALAVTHGRRPHRPTAAALT
jgi:short-subunit dehydrogenase